MRSPRLRLVNDDGTVRYDLMYGMLSLYDWRWSTATSTPRMRASPVPFGGRSVFESYSMMTETFDLASRSRCADDIRVAQARIESILVEARKHGADPVHDDAQWLEWGARGEIPRRTLLYGGSWQFLNQPRVTPLLEEQMSIIRLALSRHPLWEDVDSLDVSTNGLSCHAGYWNITGTTGREPARISLAAWSAPAVQVDEITRVWCGIRPAYRGTANFDPLWECESNAIVGGDANFHGADTTNISSLGSPAAPPASNDWYANVDFATAPGLRNRLNIVVNEPSGGANNDHFMGRYLVLMRARATGAVGVQMRHGYAFSLTPVPAEEIYINADNYPNWELWELGQVQFPPEGSWEGLTSTTMEACGVGLWAEQLDVGAEIDIDCLILVPTAHFVYVDNASLQYHTGSPSGPECPLWVITKEDDTIVSLQNIVGRPLEEKTAEPELWYLPPDDSVVVLAAQRATSHVLTDTLDLDFAYYPRWLSYRES